MKTLFITYWDIYAVRNGKDQRSSYEEKVKGELVIVDLMVVWRNRRKKKENNNGYLNDIYKDMVIYFPILEIKMNSIYLIANIYLCIIYIQEFIS